MDKYFAFTRIPTMRTTHTTFVVLIQILQCLASNDLPFQLTSKETGFCLVKTNSQCNEIRWTTADRLLVHQKNRCVGVQGKTVGSEISLYDCDENSDLQKWECRNETLLALKGQELYIELTADNTAVLSKTIGPNNHIIISGTTSGACKRTYRELFAIGGNAAGQICMFPFLYKNQWFSDCTTFETSEDYPWCAVETTFQNELWGFCPTTSRTGWSVHSITGAYYQLNQESAVTWPQAEVSCKQQGASLLSITDPHQQAYVTVLLGKGGSKLWSGLILDREHGWKWTNGRPYRYMKWDSGHPLPNPGHNCALLDPAVHYSWQSSSCSKKLGYICYSEKPVETPTQAAQTGHCSIPWIPYSGHCFHLNRTKKSWTDAHRQCRSEGGDLVSIRNLEDQSFVISQLGYASTDGLWIGLNDKTTEGLFEWSDHSNVGFTSWEFGKPVTTTDIQDCVVITGKNGNWADRTCEEKHGFICMKLSSSAPTGEEVELDIGCKIGWRRHGSYCYFIGTESKTFDEAKDTCKISGSYLADVSNGVDNAFLISLVGMRSEKYFWLGLSNQKNLDEFVWTNKDSVRFTHWNVEMPGHQQGCVAMKTGIYAGLWDVLPCTNREKYICKHLADGAIITPAPPTHVPPKCADGWTKLESTNYCFKEIYEYTTPKRTWYDARDYCRAMGGDLISIHSSAELNALPERYRTVWIGLSAPDPATGYVWSDQSPLQFQHWEDGEPNNKNNVESCVELKMHMSRRSGSWNDVHCETFMEWICQIRAGVTPNPPPDPVKPDYNTTSDGWLEWKGNQYYINKRSQSMEEARTFCQNNHGDLVAIDSEAENVFLWKQISTNYGFYWIGLNVDLDGTVGWMDGSSVIFERWDENQPDFTNNDENCAVMTTTMGFWHDYACGYEHRSICKRRASPPVNTTVAPTVPPKGGCPEGWKKFHFKCYNINYPPETWDGARTQCKSKGGNLASILSRHEQVFLSIEMAKEPTKDLWIGLHNSRGYQFYWTDGRPMRFNNWGSERNNLPRLLHLPDLHYEGLRYDYMDYRSHFMLHTYEDEFVFHQGGCALMTTNPKTGIGKWIRRSCNDTNGYICLRKLDPSVPDSPEPTIPAEYVQLFNDSIKVVSKQMNWEEARKYCVGDGANLASLRNQWSQTYIELMAINLQASLWIGLNKKQTGGYFRYSDGWHLTFSNWGVMEPSSSRSCVYVDLDGKWKTADCSENKTTVCMKSTEVAPTESSKFPGFCPEPETRHLSNMGMWRPFKGYCYLFLTERSEWPDASASCNKHGGTLASIEDPTEQGFIESNLKTFEDSQHSFWIGLYKTHRGTWQWLDKTVMDYNNWDDGQPGYSDFGSIQISDGKWKTGSRWQDRGCICKTPKIISEEVLPTKAKTTVELQTRGHIILAVVLVVTATAIGTVVACLLFKRSGHRLPIPEKLTTFDNPLFFSNDRARPDLVDTNKLVANEDQEDPGIVVTA